MARKLLLLPYEILSSQQKEIYKLYRQGLSNKEIAAKLNLEQRTVSTQLSRMRKKAANLSYTYKIEPGAEHACLTARQDSPANQLKKKIREDPGFFTLMYERYASEDKPAKENRLRLAAAGQESKLLSSGRAMKIKILAATGKDGNSSKIAIKMDKENRALLRDYLQRQKIRPVQTYWDDKSAVFLVSPRDAKKIQWLLDDYANK